MKFKEGDKVLAERLVASVTPDGSITSYWPPVDFKDPILIYRETMTRDDMEPWMWVTRRNGFSYKWVYNVQDYRPDLTIKCFTGLDIVAISSKNGGKPFWERKEVEMVTVRMPVEEFNSWPGDAKRKNWEVVE